MRLGLALIASAGFSTPGLAADIATNPLIIVEGRGEVETAPQIARLSYDLRGEGKTSDEAARSLVSKAERVDRALRSIDATIEPKANSVSIEEVRGSGCKSGEYDESPRLSVGPCAVSGYLAKQHVTARTNLISEAGTMVGVASRAGASDPEINGFELTDYAAARRGAIAAAIADARIKAQAIAESSGVKLGPVVSVALDGARGQEEIVVTGSRRRPVPEPERDDSPIRIAIAPSPIETSAGVTVSFSILR